MVLNLQQTKHASEWYSKHVEHVDQIISKTKDKYAPSTEDINSPSLWKPQHWKWFLLMEKKDYSVGDEVSIIRHRHGWEDGRIKGVVTSVSFRSGGAAYYTVTDSDGQDYDVYNTKDLRSIN